MQKFDSPPLAFLDFLRSRNNFIVLTHEDPDPDGLGAALGLVQALRQIGKRAECVLAKGFKEGHRFLDRYGAFITLAQRARLGKKRKEPQDLNAILVDTSDVRHLGDSCRDFLATIPRFALVDHHDAHMTGAVASYLDFTRSSSCELVYEIIRKLGLQPTLKLAEALYAGILFDSGNFAWAKTDRRTFVCATALVSLGVKPATLYRELNEAGDIASLKLHRLVLNSLELHHRNRTAVQLLYQKDLKESGASIEDAEGFVNEPLKVRSVECSLLVKEYEGGKLRCSLRSKGEVNAMEVAASFGGGGHKTAAGFGATGPLAEVKAKVLAAIAAAYAGASA